jgi:hypothetical protein
MRPISSFVLTILSSCGLIVEPFVDIPLASIKTVLVVSGFALPILNPPFNFAEASSAVSTA